MTKLQDKTQSITKRKKPSSDPTKRKTKTAPAPRKRKAKPDAKKKTPTISSLSPKVKGAKHATREDWLLAAVAAVRPLFDEIGADAFPPLRVSCGWPKGGRQSIGQCWPSLRSGDATVEIFLSPELDDVELIVAVTIHELIHAIDNCENEHKGPFRKMWQEIGFEGKATASTTGPKLADSIRLLLGNLGPYPHSRLDARLDKKQGTRMLKVVCTDEACGYTLRTTQKWIDVGLPTCCCGCFMGAE